MTDALFLSSDGTRIVLEAGGARHRLDESVPSLDWLLSNVSSAELIQRVTAAARTPVDSDGESRLNLGLQEIWAAGVTYKRSEEARERESNNSNIYTRVYGAERPELFLKAMGYDAVSSGDPVGIRYDATWSVPEPELVIVLNARLEVVGFTIGNDMSSRDIEGANPLYLPQAKVYESACAVGPRIWLQPDAAVWPDVSIHISITRAGETSFEGTTSTLNIHRTLDDLVSYLGRCKRFRHGAFLFTGTGVVPPDSFTLQAGDEVRIRIDPIGELVNSVVTVQPQHVRTVAH